jgi:hypothetical protein
MLSVGGCWGGGLPAHPVATPHTMGQNTAISHKVREVSAPTQPCPFSRTWLRRPPRITATPTALARSRGESGEWIALLSESAESPHARIATSPDSSRRRGVWGWHTARVLPPEWDPAFCRRVPVSLWGIREDKAAIGFTLMALART